MNVWLVSIAWRRPKGSLGNKGEGLEVRTGSFHEGPKLRLLGELVLQGCRIGEDRGRNRVQRKEN